MMDIERSGFRWFEGWRGGFLRANIAGPQSDDCRRLEKCSSVHRDCTSILARWSASSENNSAHSPLSNLTTSLALIVMMGWFLEKLPGLQQESPADDRAFLTPLKHKGGDLRCKSLSSSRLYYASSVQSRRAFGSVRALGRPSEPVSHTGSV
jgi:hypothetical protein